MAKMERAKVSVFPSDVDPMRMFHTSTFICPLKESWAYFIFKKIMQLKNLFHNHTSGFYAVKPFFKSATIHRQ